MNVWHVSPFWNEFDLLDVRLDELRGVVDAHILVEGDRTFQGAPKPLLLQERMVEYAQRNALGMWVALPEYANHPMDREMIQRNAVMGGLETTARPDDLVIITDADEIPSRQAVTALIHGDIPIPCRLGMKLYHYWLNLRIMSGSGIEGGLWYSPIVVHMRDLAYRSPHDWRWYANVPKIPDCGWSFSFLGDVQTHRDKLAAWSHHEWNVPPYNTEENIERARKMGIDWDFKRRLQHKWVPIDESYPRFIRENVERFSKYIGAVPEMV